jgi:hypothetical protein
MDERTESFETLKHILRDIRNPEMLDAHLWTRSLIVQETLDESPQLRHASPGQQLIGTIVRLFPQLQPATPPRRGKRLDPRWGEFGLLAALYFTPFNHGTPFPTSLLDAWGRIDPAILHFVYGKPVEALQAEEIHKYQLVGADLEYGSASTLSDWHKKGLQRFTEIILNRERFLSRTHGKSSVILSPEQAGTLATSKVRGRARLSTIRRPFWLAVTLILILALGLGSLKAWRIYNSGMLVYQDLTDLRELLGAPLDIETVESALPVLTTLHGDLSSFEAEARPVLWWGPKLGWVPVYGNDLASAPEIIGLTKHLLNASILSSQAAGPLLDEFASQDSTLNPASLTALLVQAGPELEEARAELDQALAARKGLNVERLSPRLQGPLTEELDPVLNLADETLSLAIALPGVLGAGSEGPKTYLLLVQNEDELRPTGAFITAVGTLVVNDGQILHVSFIDSGDLDNWAYPYPISPWPLEQYMNSPVLVLRDSNWFPDFPTSALYAETLFAYNDSHSVDGVIAFDQHMLVMILQVLGPLELTGFNDPVDAGNIIGFMRAAKSPPVGQPVPAGWSRKAFMDKITQAILARIFKGGDVPWESLGKTLLQGLDQKHLLLQLDDATLSGVVAKHGWDGALNPGTGDYLRVVDSNIGFNKTSALVDTSIMYDVDLTDITRPVGRLMVTHRNNSNADVECVQWGGRRAEGEEDYPINACYWNYMRVYKPAGTQLLDATPQVVPNDWMVLGHGVDGRVDELEEDIDGLQAFGTLMVVPGSASVATSFQFDLPEKVMVATPGTDQMVYSLKIDKQPGTIAIPFTLRMHLPNGLAIESAPPDAIIEGNNLLFESNLSVDLALEIVFRVK